MKICFTALLKQNESALKISKMQNIVKKDLPMNDD